MARERELNFRLNVKTVNAEAMKTAFKSVTAELDKQKQRTNELRAALDPAVLRERVRLTQQEETLRKSIAISTLKANTSTANLRRVAAMDLQKEAAQQRFDRALAEQKASMKAESYGGGIKGAIYSRLEGTRLGGVVGNLAGNSRLAQASGMGGAMGGLQAAGTVAAGAAAAAVGAAVAVAAIVKKTFDAVKQLGGAASPAALDRFNLAMADVAAVAGRTLVPVLELMGDYARMMGDFWATVLPSSSEIREAMSPLREVFAELRKALQDVAPLLRQVLITGVRALAVGMRILATVFVAFSESLREAMGIANTGGPLQSSMGASGGRGTFSSLEDYAKRVYAGALNSGQMNQQEQQTAHLQQIRKDMGDAAKALVAVAAVLGRGVGFAGNVIEGGKDVVRGGASVYQTVAGGLGSARDSIIEAVRRGLQGF